MKAFIASGNPFGTQRLQAVQLSSPGKYTFGLATCDRGLSFGVQGDCVMEVSVAGGTVTVSASPLGRGSAGRGGGQAWSD